MQIVISLVAALAFVSCTSCATATSTEPPGRSVSPVVVQSEAGTAASAVRRGGRWILFQRDGKQGAEIALVRPDGSHQHALTDDVPPGDQTNPDWDPTGKQIVWALSDGGTDDLWISDVGGKHVRRLLDCVAPCLWLDDPAWSPDGNRIVFSRTVEKQGAGVSTLETVNVKTGKRRVLIGPWKTEFTAGARWSPDGRRVVFERVHKAGPEVEAEVTGVTLAKVRTDRPHRRVRGLTDPALFAATADWSPDGRWIVYSALAKASDSAPDLFLIHPRGGDPLRVTELADDGGYAIDPGFARGGRWIVFVGGTDFVNPSVLKRVRLDGSKLGPAIPGQETPGRHPRMRPNPRA